MMTMSLGPASIASMAASFAYGAGTKMMEAFALACRTASFTLSYTGTPSTVVPPLPGVTPATTFVPNSSIAWVWNWPWWPVMPWTTTRLFAVRTAAVKGAPRLHFDRELCGFLHGLRGVHSDQPQDLLRAVFVDALDSGDNGDARVHVFEGPLYAQRDRVRLRDSAEDVQQDDGRIRFDQDLERLLHFLRIVRPAEVEERPTPAPFEVQDVERRHRQPGAVGNHADVAIELDERDALLVGFLLQRRPILVQVRILRVAVFRVVVDHELRVAGDHPAVARDRERVDLHELRVLLPEQIVRPSRDVRDLVAGVLRQAKEREHRPQDIRLEARHRRHVLHENLVVGYRLDLHPA